MLPSLFFWGVWGVRAARCVLVSDDSTRASTFSLSAVAAMLKQEHSHEYHHVTIFLPVHFHLVTCVQSSILVCRTSMRLTSAACGCTMQHS